MNTHYRDTRKIDPTRGATLGDGTPNNQDRVEIGHPTGLQRMGGSRSDTSKPASDAGMAPWTTDRCGRCP